MGCRVVHRGRGRAAVRLSAEEERALLARAQAGDRAARDALVERLLPLVISVASRYRGARGLTDDLVQEGTLGLMQAIAYFEPARRNRFVSYAIWWVRAYVKRHFDAHRSQVRGGAARRADVSLDAPVRDDDDARGLERLVDPRPGAEAALLRVERAREVRRALNEARGRLGELGWDVLHARTLAEDPATLEVLGRRWGLSREGIRLKEARAFELMRRHLEPWAAVPDAG